MRQRFALILTLAAWLCATGSHWDLVQTFAWGKMFARYAQTMPASEALRLTFTPDNFCGLCEFVQDAKRESETNGSSAPAESGTQKILLALAATPAVAINAPAPEPWLLSDHDLPAPMAVAPPVPPPRA